MLKLAFGANGAGLPCLARFHWPWYSMLAGFYNRHAGCRHFDATENEFCFGRQIQPHRFRIIVEEKSMLAAGANANARWYLAEPESFFVQKVLDNFVQ